MIQTGNRNECWTQQHWIAAKIVTASNRVVFFGGAGVSTESGIPDFRSKDGLYNLTYDYPPETMLGHSFYRSHREEFFRFYRDKVLHADAKPNAAHRALAKLEEWNYAQWSQKSTVCIRLPDPSWY